MQAKRETLIQVEPRLGEVLLGITQTTGYRKTEITALSPEDAVRLAQQLAAAAEMIFSLQKEMNNGTDSSIQKGTLSKS